MQELQIFKNEKFGEVRIEVVNGKELFCASDVARALGYKRPNDAITQHCKGTVKHRIATKQGNSSIMNFIPESDIYRLIVRSELKEAEVFEKWLFEEVLPTIRKTGGIVTNEDMFVNTYLPFADDNTKLMFKNTLETVRKQNEIIAKQRDENIKLINKTETQHKLIDTMTESYDGTYIRMVSHDYINKACKQTNQSQSELYNKVYKLVGRSLKIDLDVQLKNFSNKERQIVKSNMEYNRENNLKGMDRKTPCFIKDSKAEISKLEFICNVLGRGIVVLESIAKVCEVGISEVVSKYNIIKETAKIKGDDYNV